MPFRYYTCSALHANIFQHVPCVKLSKPFSLIMPSIYFSCFFLVLNIFWFQFSLSHDVALLKLESRVITIHTYHIITIIVFGRRLYECKRYISNNTGPIHSSIRKDVLSHPHQVNSVIHKYSFGCGVSCIERTIEQVHARIKKIRAM